MYKTHFCIYWKSNFICFNKEIEELKLNFKVGSNVTTDKHVKISIIYEYKPENVPSQLTIVLFYDLETFSTE